VLDCARSARPVQGGWVSQLALGDRPRPSLACGSARPVVVAPGRSIDPHQRGPSAERGPSTSPARTRVGVSRRGSTRWPSALRGSASRWS